MDTPDTKKLGQEPGVAPEPEPQPEPQPRPKADTFEAAPEKKLDWEQLRTGGSMASGTVLIVLGVLFALAQLLGIRLGHYMWPLFIIVPGLALFALALTVGGGAGEPLSAVGGVVTMTGLLMFYQNLMNHWESWAYAWALVGPTAVGLGFIAYGTFKGRKELVKSGLDIAKIGLIMFVIGAVFFELIIGISGFGLGRYGWALALIALGVVMLLRSLISRRQED